TEFEFEDEHVRLRLVRGGSSSSPREMVSQIVAAPTAAAAPPPTTTRAEDASEYITSPFVGTFYAAPGPGKPPFASIGDTVKTGQTVCIIEAMKLMNEIESEFDCLIEERLVDDGQPVEFGMKLFRCRKV
ncbi:MAG TPA: acetyl-CoA carboxylase biotin carboxyl carrier protein, partial [Polyangium sp.]|nr:acetyl-CoA carboxylase biotin carboxyl carrier protein [Polyangium sp.]